jgi:uncharacterized protein
LKGFRGRLVPIFVVFVVWLGITIGLAPRGMGDPTLQIARSIGWQFVIGCTIALVAHLAIIPDDRGYGMPKPSAIWIMLLPLTICAALFGVAESSGLPALNVILLIFFNAVLIGTSEEVMFRGLIFSALRMRLNVRLASIMSSALFGLSHVSNSLLTGDLRASVLQALSAMMLGEFLAVLRMRTGSLWPCILFHTLWNMGLVLMSQAGEPLPDWAFFVPFGAVIMLAIYAMILWRPLALNPR